MVSVRVGCGIRVLGDVRPIQGPGYVRRPLMPSAVRHALRRVLRALRPRTGCCPLWPRAVEHVFGPSPGQRPREPGSIRRPWRLQPWRWHGSIRRRQLLAVPGERRWSVERCRRALLIRDPRCRGLIVPRERWRSVERCRRALRISRAQRRAGRESMVRARSGPERGCSRRAWQVGHSRCLLPTRRHGSVLRGVALAWVVLACIAQLCIPRLRFALSGITSADCILPGITIATLTLLCVTVGRLSIWSPRTGLRPTPAGLRTRGRRQPLPQSELVPRTRLRAVFAPVTPARTIVARLRPTQVRQKPTRAGEIQRARSRLASASLMRARPDIAQLTPSLVRTVRLKPKRVGVVQLTPSRIAVDRLMRTRTNVVQPTPSRVGKMRLTLTRIGLTGLKRTRTGISRPTLTRIGLTRLERTWTGKSQLTLMRIGLARLKRTRTGESGPTLTRIGLARLMRTRTGKSQLTLTRIGLARLEPVGARSFRPMPTWIDRARLEISRAGEVRRDLVRADEVWLGPTRRARHRRALARGVRRDLDRAGQVRLSAAEGAGCRLALQQIGCAMVLRLVGCLAEVFSREWAGGTGPYRRRERAGLAIAAIAVWAARPHVPGIRGWRSRRLGTSGTGTGSLLALARLPETGIARCCVRVCGIAEKMHGGARPRHAFAARGTVAPFGIAAARPVHPPAPAFRARPPPGALSPHVLRAADAKTSATRPTAHPRFRDTGVRHSSSFCASARDRSRHSECELCYTYDTAPSALIVTRPGTAAAILGPSSGRRARAGRAEEAAMDLVRAMEEGFLRRRTSEVLAGKSHEVGHGRGWPKGESAVERGDAESGRGGWRR